MRLRPWGICGGRRPRYVRTADRVSTRRTRLDSIQHSNTNTPIHNSFIHLTIHQHFGVYSRPPPGPPPDSTRPTLAPTAGKSPTRS
jgi:hypothetical protein